MARTIRIRGVPDKVHRVLKLRAAKHGMRLSDYIKRELEQAVQLPTMQEWFERVRQRSPIRSTRSTAAIIRELRGS